MICILTAVSVDVAAQVDKRDVRRGNRDFRKENFKEAEIEYRKGIVKDSLSVASNYNLASTLYRQNNAQEAQKVLDRIKEVAPASEAASDYYYNLGDAALANQDYQTAVDAFKQSLLRNPGDLDAKENYIYARKKLEEQQNQQNQNNQDNQQNQDQNQDQNKDQNQNDQDNKDDQQDKQEQDNQQNQQNQQDQNGQQPQQQPKITPQAAQQMLQAIQAKEKETQDKVNKEKAKALQSRQKEKNW